MGLGFVSRLEKLRASIKEDIARLDSNISAKKARSGQEVQETGRETSVLEGRVTEMFQMHCQQTGWQQA